jgi:hypothetical protein
MKIYDERIQKQEVNDLSDEVAEGLAAALAEDYGVIIGNDHQQFLKNEVRKILAKFFNVKP